MKRLAAAALTAALALATTGVVHAATPPQPTGVAGAWTPVFADEFTGPTLDRTKWDPYWFSEGGVISGTATYSENVMMSATPGRLLMRLHKRPDGVLGGAAIRTTYAPGRYQVQVGDFVEAKMFVPGSVGEDVWNWPAFWINYTPKWPTGGEHDIFEGVGGTGKITYHYQDSTGVNRSACQLRPPGSWSNAYHTFGAWRQASQVLYYWDGQLMETCATHDNGGPEEIILTLIHPRSPDTRAPHTEWANRIRVDYVRAWRQ